MAFFYKERLRRMLKCIHLCNLAEWNEIEMWILPETFDGSRSLKRHLQADISCSAEK